MEATALAEPTSDERALALTLFKRGRDAMAAGQLDVACPSFEESQRLDPGGGTLLNLAVCHEKQGRNATAWTEYAEALAIARRDGRADRVDLAQTNRAALEARLVHLTVVVPEVAREPRLRVMRDGIAIPREAWSIAVPVDPGEHVVEAWIGETRVFLERKTVTTDDITSVITIEQSPPAPEPPRDVAVPPPPPLPPLRVEAPRPDPDASRTVAGWALVGSALAAAGMGAFFGVTALGDKAESDRGCPLGRCSRASVEANDRAKVEADISTGSFAVAIVVAGIGVYLLATHARSWRSGRLAWPMTF
jgi:hypothetical protein